MNKKLTLSDVQQKDIKIISYLVVSGLLGLALAWLLERPELALILSPMVNYIIYRVNQELSGQGYRSVMK